MTISLLQFAALCVVGIAAVSFFAIWLLCWLAINLTRFIEWAFSGDRHATSC